MERKLCKYWCEKARKHMCVTDRRDMTLAFKVGLNPKASNQPRIKIFTQRQHFKLKVFEDGKINMTEKFEICFNPLPDDKF